MAKNLLASAIAVALSLTLCEVAIRLFYRDITTTYDNRSYFALRWKRDHLRLNSLGYRDREFQPAKPDGAYRIAALGDSFTFGQGIDEEKRFSNLIAERLKARQPAVEVLNFGRAGDNTTDQLRALNQTVLALRPDFVLLQWYINDVEQALPAQTAVATSAAPAPGPSVVNRFKQAMLNHVAGYFFVADVLHRVRAWRGQSYERELFARVGDPASPEWRQAETSLREIFRVCREHDVRVGVVLVPDLAPIRDEYRHAYLHQRVLDVCQQEGEKCVDLLPVFEPYLRDPERVDDLWVNQFDTHMSAHANRLAADHLVAAFEGSLAP